MSTSPAPKAWLALAIVAGCHTAPPSPPELTERPAELARSQSLRDAPPVGRVVVPWTAPLYLMPSRAAAEIHLRDPDEPWDKGRVTRPSDATDADASLWPQPGYVFDVVGSSVEFLAVQPVFDSEGTCASWMPEMAPWGVTLYVERSAPLAVLSRALKADFADGSTVEIAAGARIGAEVSVDRRGTREYAIEADGVGLVVAVPEDAIGRTYIGGAAFTAIDGDLTLDAHARLLYDSGRVVRRFGRAHSCRGPVRIIGGPGEARQRRIEVHSRCVRLRVDVAAPQLLRLDETCAPIDWSLDLTQRLLLSYGVQSGARLFWPGGERAGTAHGSAIYESAPREIAGRVCFDLAKGFAWREPLTLCAEPDDVSVWAPSPPPRFRWSDPTAMSGYGDGNHRTTPRAPAPPALRIEALTVHGSLDKGLLGRILDARLGDLRACHEYAPRSPEPGARFAVEFVIGAKGTVIDSTVPRESVPNPKIAECIKDIIQGWQFPIPEGGRPVIVVTPFKLGP